MAERSRLAAEVALVREPGAGAGLQEAQADASEECVAPEGSAATIRAEAVAARKRKAVQFSSVHVSQKSRQADRICLTRLNPASMGRSPYCSPSDHPTPHT